MSKRSFLSAALLLILGYVLPIVSAETFRDCKCFPGDRCWPSKADWTALNGTVNGRLVTTVPLASPCHTPQYDAAKCAELQKNWLWPEQHFDSSSSVMAPFFTNNSCSPFTPENTPCLLGNYINYAVNVSKPTDVSAAIRFATKHNIRFVIRNTGHDYNGKSTGAGALGVWMHNLKDISFSDWKDPYYSGKAIKMGAGVQGIEAYEAAYAQGLAVVGGECPTVGLAGGYTQGGGHSALASKFGLAADQTLEFEVIDGRGEIIKANRKTNSDLYWALSGGGGGTYGVVYSMTSKAHTDIPTSGFNLTFASDGVSQDTYYSAISKYHSLLPSITETGAMSVWYFTNASFAISPLTGPNIPASELTKLVKPFTDYLDEVGIEYTSTAADFPGYLPQFKGMQGPIQVGIAQYGGWLIPRSVVENNNEALTSAYRAINNDGAQFIGVGVNVSAPAANVYNAVNPAWRTATIDTIITTPWSFTSPVSDMVKLQEKMTNQYIPSLEALAPDSGAYLNEADFRQPNWKQAFYGANYEKLRKIKSKHDPKNMFYAVNAVGSDEWTVGNDGRMCEAGRR